MGKRMKGTQIAALWRYICYDARIWTKIMKYNVEIKCRLIYIKNFYEKKERENSEHRQYLMNLFYVGWRSIWKKKRILNKKNVIFVDGISLNCLKQTLSICQSLVWLQSRYFQRRTFEKQGKSYLINFRTKV